MTCSTLSKQESTVAIEETSTGCLFEVFVQFLRHLYSLYRGYTTAAPTQPLEQFVFSRCHHSLLDSIKGTACLSL